MEQLFPLPEPIFKTWVLNQTQGSFENLLLTCIIMFIGLSLIALFSATYRKYKLSAVLILVSGFYLFIYAALTTVVDTEFKKVISTVSFTSKNFSFIKRDSQELKINCEADTIKNCLKVLNLHQDAFPAAQNEIILSSLPEVPEIDVD